MGSLTQSVGQVFSIEYGLVDSVIIYAHIGTGLAGGLTLGESARSLAQPAWRGGVLGCGFPKHK